MLQSGSNAGKSDFAGGLVLNQGQPLVHRERIVSRMKAGMIQKVIYVRASAGYGKTSAVVDWQATMGKIEWEFVWVPLEMYDNSFEAVCFRLTKALQTLDPSWSLNSVFSAEGELSANWRHLIDELFGKIRQYNRHFSIIFDNFQYIDNPNALSLLLYTIVHAPNNMHFVIISESDWFELLSRLRLEGGVTEITDSNLAFNLDEARNYFSLILGLPIDESTLCRLIRVTEGWPAGLRLAGICALERNSDVSLLVDFDLRNEYITAYLKNVVYDHQPTAVREFLVASSILGVFNVDLYDYALQSQEGYSFIRFARKHSLFLRELSKEGWYRYSSAFAAFLATEAAKRPKQWRTDIHLRAYEWLNANGHEAMAFYHALLADDAPEAVSKLEEYFGATIDNFDFTLVYEWFSTSPLSHESEDERVPIYLAIVDILVGRLGKAETHLRAARKRFDSRYSSQKAPVGSKRLFEIAEALYQCNSVDCAEGGARLRLLMQNEGISHTLRGLAAHGLVLSYMASGDYIEARNVLREATQSIRRANGITKAYVASLCMLAQIEVECGDLAEGLHLFESARRHARRIHCSDMDLCVATGLWAVSHQMRKEGWESMVIDDEAFFLCDPLAQPWMCFEQTGCRLVEYYRSRRDLDAARSVEALLDRRFGNRRFNSALRSFSHLERLMIAVDSHDEDSIEQWVYKRKELRRDGSPLSPIECVGLGWQVSDNGLVDEGVALIDDACAHLRQGGCVNMLIRALVTKAHILSRAQRDEEALVDFREALLLGQRGGFLDVFASGDDTTRRLLARAREDPLLLADEGLPDDGCLHREYIERICRLTNVQPTRSAQKSMQDASPKIVMPYFEPLTIREQEVLRCMTNGMNSQEISKHLYISQTTAKTHIRNIYRKLDVHSRTEAVKRALDYGLLDQ